MNESIESIWEKGFIDDMALVAPKINNLYAQKSQNLVDKFEYMFAVNQKAVLIGACVIGAALSFVGAPVLGVVVGAMLCGLVWIGKRQLAGLKRIHKDDSSLAYLQAFDTWLDEAISQYDKVYRFFYPAVFVLCAVRFVYSDLGSSVLIKIETISNTGVQFVTVSAFVAIAVIGLVLGLTGGRIYRADVKMVYGREINKLKELISDMKALKASS